MVNAKVVAEYYTNQMIDIVSRLNKKPVLAICHTKLDGSNQSYIKSLWKLAEKIGIEIVQYEFSGEPYAAYWTADREHMKHINSIPGIDGIITMNPFPDTIRDFITIEKDVEGITSENLKNLYMSRDIRNCPATAYGIMLWLKYMNFDLEGKTAVVVGRSNTVGRPMFHLFERAGATCIQCHSHTKNLSKMTQLGDIVVTATGVPKLITRDMLKPFSILMDAGFTVVDDKICGDADYEPISHSLAEVSPVPGGVGIMTNIALMMNLVDRCVEKEGIVYE